jgi:hypothetical protein
MASENKPRFIGITDEITTCDCCGRSNLKSTVMISLDGESDPVHYGSDCAAKTLAGRGIKMTGRAIIAAAEKEQAKTAQIARWFAGLEQLEIMQATGAVRYIIGGVERGAVLSVLIEGTKNDLRRAGQFIYPNGNSL